MADRLPPYHHAPPPRIPREKGAFDVPSTAEQESARLANRISLAVYDQRVRLTPYCDVNVKVQDGKPVLVEITSKHKPTTTTTGHRVYEVDKEGVTRDRWVSERIEPPNPPRLIGSEPVRRGWW